MNEYSGLHDTDNHSDMISMADRMKVDILVNKDNRAIVLHDKPLPGKLQWAELDVENASLVFPTNDGSIIHFGMKICPQVLSRLQKAARIQVAQIRNRKVFDIYDLALLITGEAVN